MFKQSLIVTVAATIAGAATVQGADPMRVKDLLSDGWTILDKKETREEHKGVAPYEHLTRVVQVSTYMLGKAGKVVECRIAYDSQQETMKESCTPKQ